MRMRKLTSRFKKFKGFYDRQIPSRVTAGNLGVTPATTLTPVITNPLLTSGEDASTHLETLPVEIQEIIISELPTLQTLSCLVHASPQLHALYARNRSAMLGGCLSRTLGTVMVDSLYCRLSGTDQFQQTRNLTLIQDLLHAYQERRGASPDCHLGELPLEDLVAMARFHTSVIEPLAEEYVTWALAVFSDSSQINPPNGTEQARIHRALYRLQIFCNVCGSRTVSGDSETRITDSVGRARVLSQFPAWEVEELLCIHEFAKTTYDRVFHDVAWDLDEVRNPKYADIALGSENEFLELDTQYSRESSFPEAQKGLRNLPTG